MLAATSHSAEVSKPKQSLERAEEELGRMKKHLEDSEGMQFCACLLKSKLFKLTKVS